MDILFKSCYSLFYIMATNVGQDSLPQPAISYCKKCNIEHEKPVGAKCEKMAQEEKRDSSCDNVTVKKTPKSKGTGETNKKMLDMVMATMTSVTEKLSAMNKMITRLALCIEPTPAKAARKSCSWEHTKRREVSDHEEALFGSPLNTSVIHDGGTSYSQVFADTAVALKLTEIPARTKKLKSDGVAGCIPLPRTTAALVSVSSITDVMSQVASQTTATTSVSQVQVWTTPQPQIILSQANTEPIEKVTVQDVNQNPVFAHVDQFGNPVRVQAAVETLPMTHKLVTQATGCQGTQDLGITATLDTLRSNPMIQQLVKERIAVLESKMKAEVQQGIYRRRKSGRYNVSETPHATPHLRWPNEACVIGTARKRTTFDELSIGQFVIGFVTNILDTHHVETQRNMLTELVETVKLAENISWPIARGAFSVSMLKIEEESITWNGVRTLADHRLTYSQSADFCGSTTMSPRPSTPTPGNGSLKKIVCKWYNEGTCPHSGDHLDSSGTMVFCHVCLYCYRTLKRHNVHVEVYQL